MLTKNLKEFLEKNIELIEENKFDELYKKAENQLFFPDAIGNLTRMLRRADIDPLLYMHTVPYCYFYGDSEIETINIPDNIEFIDSEAFANCSNLESVSFGRSVSVIYYGAFNNCRNLSNVYLNDGLLEIGHYAFKNTNIEKIRLPQSLRDIDIQAFPELMTMQVYRGSYAESFAITNGYEVEYLN